MNIKATIIVSLLFLSLPRLGNSQNVSENYNSAYYQLAEILKNNQSFKEAVFVVENTYFDDSLSKENFFSYLASATEIIKKWAEVNPLKNYRYKDSGNLLLNYALYHFLKDTTKVATHLGIGIINTPYTYDFNDFFGHKDWSNMFVTKLLTTHKGNCHSLPYLYKILADELGATCWLSFAPPPSLNCKSNLTA